MRTFSMDARQSPPAPANTPNLMSMAPWLLRASRREPGLAPAMLTPAPATVLLCWRRDRTCGNSPCGAVLQQAGVRRRPVCRRPEEHRLRAVSALLLQPSAGHVGVARRRRARHCALVRRGDGPARRLALGQLEGTVGPPPSLHVRRRAAARARLLRPVRAAARAGRRRAVRVADHVRHPHARGHDPLPCAAPSARRGNDRGLPRAHAHRRLSPVLRGSGRGRGVRHRLRVLPR